MTNADFFVRLLHAMRDYDLASLLHVLLLQDADRVPARTTWAQLATGFLGGAIDRYRVRRASEALVRMGLISVRVHPKTWTEYSVNADAVAELLRRPLPDTRYLPGVSDVPIPFLQRLAAMEDSAQPGPAAPVAQAAAEPVLPTTEAQS